MNKLKPFGAGSMAHHYGYTLPVLVSWIEDLVSTEADTLKSSKTKKYKRFRYAEDALINLQKVLAIGEEE